MEYSKREVLQYIAENDVKFIKLFFTDIFGVLKSISIQPSELERAFETGISFDASAVKGFLEVDRSDLFLVPDPSTLSVLPWRPQHGRVVRFYCNIRYPDGKPFEGDTRYILQQTCEKLKKDGYSVQIGTECEFYLFQLDENGNPTKIPHDNGGYCDLAPLDRGENVRRDICITLEQMGIQPEMSHHETGPGQHEVDFRYSSPICAADNLATFKTVVSTVAARNGLYASFAPKPLDEKAGNGLHINLSLSKDGKNLFADKDFCEEAKCFIAGIMNRMKGITAVLNSSKSSYKRFGSFEAPMYVGWSHGNRSQLIRIPNVADSSRGRIELRSPDSTCNQYSAFALIIQAGMEGIKNKEKLSDELTVNIFNSSEHEKAGLQKLPATFDEAVSIALKSKFVQSVLPKVTLDSFSNYKGNDVEL